MIGRLRGVVVERSLDGTLVLDVGGVGYEVFVPLRDAYQAPAHHGRGDGLPGAAEVVTLHVHTHVREDAFTLFGFSSPEDRAAFRTLLGVSSIGPKVALAILGHLDATQLANAIARQDKTLLTKIPGVGKKLVERILLELKDKLGFVSAASPSTMTAGGPIAAPPVPAGPLGAAASALMSMGFRPQEAERAVAAIAPTAEGKTLEQLVRDALAAVTESMAAKKRAPREIPDAGLTNAGLTNLLDPAPSSPGTIAAGSFGESAESALERSLRPSRFDDFVGQSRLKDNLKVYVEAAKVRAERAHRDGGGKERGALDHVLFFGPPGLGKTTLAHILAAELGVHLHLAHGPAIEHKGQLAALLTKLGERDVLFIDEIHRLSAVVEENLYTAMEDYRIDVVHGDGPMASTLQIPIQPFTLVGATTRTGLLTGPLLSRFGIEARLDYYEPAELAQIVRRSAGILEVEVDDEGAAEIARRARGTPRIANRLLSRARDFAQVLGDGRLDAATAKRALERLEIDEAGLDVMSRRFLKAIIELYGGGPVGIEALAATLSEPRDTLEDVVEPYLLQHGFVARTARGRMVTERAYTHLGLQKKSSQGSLF